MTDSPVWLGIDPGLAIIGWAILEERENALGPNLNTILALPLVEKKLLLLAIGFNSLPRGNLKKRLRRV